MQLTEQQFLNIILEEITLMENFLDPVKNDTIPLSDDVIKAIVSLTRKNNLKEQEEEQVSDDMKKRIRNLVYKFGDDADAVVNVAKKLAVPATFIASIVGGGLAGAFLAGGPEVGDSVADQDVPELQVQDAEELGFTDVFGSGLDDEKFHGMDRFEVSNELWNQYDLNITSLDNAPVSSSVWIYKYKMVAPEDISPNDVLPLSGAEAQDYYNALKNRVDKDPMVELPLLKKMVYGNVGKWSGGTGNPDQNFRVAEDGSQILPPDWTVAYTLYADLMEERTKDLMDYYIDNPDDRQELYQMLGVQDRDEFNKFVQDTMYKIGRPMEVR